MKIEKLSNNKLKVIFSINELEKDNIDYHTFMSGSYQYKKLISQLLFIAKDEFDFDTQNCNIEIDTFEVNQGDFVLTITKFEKSNNKLKVKRKQGKLKMHPCLYEFSSVDYYGDYLNFLRTNFLDLYNIVSKHSEFYSFDGKYFLIINGANLSENDKAIFNTTITEFANFKSNSEALILKLKECFS